jgi:hypothetical protein
MRPRHNPLTLKTARAGLARPVLGLFRPVLRLGRCPHDHLTVSSPSAPAGVGPPIGTPHRAFRERPHAVGAHVAEGHWRPGRRSRSIAHAGRIPQPLKKVGCKHGAAPASIDRLGPRKGPFSIQDFGTRTIEANCIVPARRNRQAVNDLAVTAAKLNRD